MAKKATLVFSTLALLLVVFGAYYLYLSERESYFIDRNFRLLALWSKKISETVDEYKYHFQYMISEFEDAPFECHKNVSSKNTNKKLDCKQKSRKERFRNKFEKRLAKHFEGKLISVSFCSKLSGLGQNDFVNDQPRIRAQLSSRNEDLLSLIYEKKRQDTQRECKDTAKADLSISKVTSHLITDRAFDDAVITEEVFSDVIIFDSKTGKVHFQANHAQANHALFRIDDFRDIVAQRSDTEGIFSFFSNNSKTRDVQNGKSGSSTPPRLKDLLQSPTHRRITIGDISYELFTQPVVLSGLTLKEQTHYRQKSDGSARLILAGFVKTEKFQSEYRAIPHTWLLLILLFVLLGLLSLPIIHLAFMDHHEPVRPMTVLSLVGTCVFGTALITLLFLDVVWLGNVRSNLDNQLKETAENIRDMFKDDLEKTLDRLLEYDHSITFVRDFTCVTQDENCPFIYRHACAADDNCTSGGKSKDDKWVARKNYRDLCDKKICDLFFWVDEDNRMRITWYTRSEYYLRASGVSLAHRDYVKEILKPESSLWHTEYGQPAFYAQSLISLGTDSHTMVLSTESSKGKAQKWVAAIETEFQFLKSEAIPNGTGFAVIEDEGGKVLFHSDDKRSLWENFFEETDNNARLKAHAFSRTEGPFAGRYWGKGHGFYSTPLPGVPWSLVVFRNKELFRTTNFEALLLAGTLFALYIGFSILVLGAIWLLTKARGQKISISWFWPDIDRPYWYYTAIVLIFFLVGILLFSFDIFPEDCAIWFVFPYLLSSLIGFWFLTKVCPKPHPKISPEQLHRRYAFALLSFLLLFSALPMGIFFKAGADREMILAMKYNLITLGHKLRQIPDLDFSQIQIAIPEINDTSRSTDGCPKNISSENPNLLQHSIHLSVIAKTGLCLSDDDSTNHEKPSLLDKIHQRIRENSLSRLANPVSIETLGLLWEQPPGKPFDWINSPSHTISLKFQAPSKPETEWVILRSWPPSDIWWSISDFPAKGHFWGSIVLIVFVSVLVMVLIFIVSRIFPIARKSSNNLKTENSNQETGNLLVIGLPEALSTSCAKKETIDCRQISDSLEWWKIKREVLSTQKTGVIFEHFEYQFGVPRIDRAKLKLLSALLVKGRHICVLSTINPLKFDRNDEPLPSSPDASKSPASVSLQEWSQAFQSFSLHYHGTPLDSEHILSSEPYYEAIWQARTIDERITLHHLARDGFVHTENPDLPALFDLGLINPKPDPLWLDKNFAEYVLSAAQRDGVDKIAHVKSRRQGQWHVWKWPIAIVFVVLVLGLLSTQQELHNAVVLVLSLLPVLLPILSELFGGQQKDDIAT